MRSGLEIKISLLTGLALNLFLSYSISFCSVDSSLDYALSFLRSSVILNGSGTVYFSIELVLNPLDCTVDAKGGRLSC